MKKSSQKKLLTISLILGMVLILAGCQFMQDSAGEVRGAFDKTVEKAVVIKDGVTDAAGQVKSTLDETKEAINTKVEQVKEAGEKIDEAKKALGEANEAVGAVTK